LKSRLLELSPAGSDEVLLKQKIKSRLDTSGTVEFVGSGKKTVDVEEIKQRLVSLGVEMDWKRIDRLTVERNNIEHYYPQVSDEALRGLAADVLVIVRDFTTRELKREPRELFGENTWEQLLTNKEVFDAERKDCLDALRKVSWSTDVLREACEEYSCPGCAAQLFYPVDSGCELDELKLQCRSCGAIEDADAFVEGALQEFFAGDRDRSIKRGGTDPLAACPECFLETFVVDEDVCMRCCYERQYSECIRCGATLDVEEQELGGLCGYCEHMTSKDD
jgi:hypothetical protein